MYVSVNGARLWFDVEGAALVPDGSGMRARPTIVLVHGGPGTYDHSYFKPEFSRLARCAQVVYLDLRGHGRSESGSAGGWTFEACSDDLREFCDVLGIHRPVVYGHSMGGIVTMLYGARHPGHAAGLVLQSTLARFDHGRLVEGFRRQGGDAVADLASRSYRGEALGDAEWDRVFRVFGPRVPGADQLARRIRHPATAERGMELFRRLDVRGELAHADRPVLVCVGALDPVTPPEASLEVAAALPAGNVRLEVMEDTGHFPWLDAGERYWTLVEEFVTMVAGHD